MGLQFGVDIGRNSTLAQVADEARVAEECGFDHITLVDQQNLDRDVYLMMMAAAQATKRIKVGQGVTVPTTRHPSVTANATATLDEMVPGRIFLGIGAGGSALRSMGQFARPMQEYREYVEFIKKYMRGEEAEFQGTRARSAWIKRPVPLYMAAGAPVSLRIAGELADGVIIGVGANPEVAKWRIELVHEGAKRVGRDPTEIDIWLFTMCVIAETKEAARREVSAANSRVTWLTLRDRPGSEIEGLRSRLRRTIPDLEGLIEEGRRAYEAYDEYEHEMLDSAHSKLVTQRMIDFVHLTGPAAEIRQRIAELQRVGVKNISVELYTVVDRKAAMRKIADEIMPYFR
jgi:5,10-methylenetetrahydromethanopterin reductase